MTQKERAAMQQALEALIWETGSTPELIDKKTMKAITALREALAEQAEQEQNSMFMEGYRIGLAEMREKCAKVVTEHAPTCSPHWVSYVVAIRSIKFEGDTGFRPVSEMFSDHFAASGKPIAEQKPVAWFVQYKNRHEFVFGSKPEFIVDGVVEPLYAAPARTKDLTDDEIRAIRFNWERNEFAIDFARAVIEKFKEKNK